MQQHIAIYSNEKGQESKQKRKTPLTTIAISQEYAQKLDEYLKGTGITRKEFVELACDYFQRTGFDIRGEAFDLSPLEKVAGRLEQSAKIMEQANEGTEAVRQLLRAVREQTTKQFPAPELIAHAAEEKAKAEAKNEEQKRRLPSYDPRTPLCRSTRKRHTENCAEYVTNKELSENQSKYRTIENNIYKAHHNNT